MIDSAHIDFQTGMYYGCIECVNNCIQYTYKYRKDKIRMNRMIAFLKILKRQYKIKKEELTKRLEVSHSNNFVEGYFFGIDRVISDFYSDLLIQKYEEKKESLLSARIVGILRQQKFNLEQEKYQYANYHGALISNIEYLVNNQK